MIATVVVTYAAPPGMLAACVAAIGAAGGVDLVVVVDTGGHADVAQDGVVGHHRVDVVRIDNRGYGAAANAGFSLARSLGAELFVLLNDDVIVREGWIEALVAEVTPGVGAVQPKLLHRPDGEQATELRINSLGVRIGPDGAGTDIGDGDGDGDRNPARSPLVAATDLELFTGGAVLLTSSFLDATGGFDERWFLYYEDVDLARRGAELGWRYRLAPAAVVEHRRGTSTAAQPARTRYLQERNRLWSAVRHEPPATVVRAFWLSIRRLGHAPYGVHAKALAAGLAGAPRRTWERRRAR